LFLALGPVKVSSWHGLSSSSNWNTFVGINTYPESPTITGYQDQLFHPAYNYGSYYGTRYEALFVAPFTGNYNFRCSADNQCMMYLSTDETEANRQVIIDFRTGYATSFFTFTS